MNLILYPEILEIQLTGPERLWSCHLSPAIALPLSQILRVSGDRPITTWREIRAPGTFVPGLIKAGTYYTERGREFWYTTREPNTLLIDLKDHYYKRVGLALSDAALWREQIQAAIGGGAVGNS